MTWTLVGTNSTTVSSGRSITPSAFPAGVQEGDLVIFTARGTPDDWADIPVCLTNGWVLEAPAGYNAYAVSARYHAALPLPTFSLTSGAANYRYYCLGAVFRPTKHWSLGPKIYQAGSPPATTDVATATPDTLIVFCSTSPGTSGSAWSIPAGFTSAIVTSSASTPRVGICWKNQATIATLAALGTGLGGAYDSSYNLVTASENSDIGALL